MEIGPIFSSLLRSRTGPLLVALQVAISLAILANALFVVEQRIAVSKRPSGVAKEQDVGYVYARPLERRSHPEAIAEQRRELAALEAIPGVVSAAWTNQMPMSRSGNSSSIRLSPTQARESATPAFYSVQPGFVETMGMKLVEGRDLAEGDMIEYDPRTARPDDGVPQVVLVSLPLAKFLFPDATTYVGRELWQGSPERMQPMRIVGVVENLMSPGAGSQTGAYSVILPIRAVQKRDRNRRLIKAHVGQDRRDLERMREIGISRGASLVAMLLHGVDIGFVEQRLVHVGLVALNALDKLVLTHHDSASCARKIKRRTGHSALDIDSDDCGDAEVARANPQLRSRRSFPAEPDLRCRPGDLPRSCDRTRWYRLPARLRQQLPHRPDR